MQEKSVQLDGSFKDLLIKGGILIPVISIIGYGLTYVYEAGYCDYFGIPKGFIKIELQNVIATFVSIAYLVFSAWFMIYYSLFFFLKDFDYPPKGMALFLVRKVFLIAVPITLIAVIIGSHAFSEIGWLDYFLIFGYLPIILYSEFIYHFKKGKSIARTIEDAFKLDLALRTYSHLSFKILIFRFVLPLIEVIIVVFAIIYSFKYVGWGRAYHSHTFEVVEMDKPRIILATYGELFICTTLLDDTNKVFNSFELVHQSDLSTNKYKITRKKLGQLKYLKN